MKLALLALFAFAAPAPFAEAFTAEEEVVVQTLRTAPRLVSAGDPSKASPTPVSRPAVRRIVTDLPTRSLLEWTPAVFTRPPPRT